MVDLQKQYLAIKDEIDLAINKCITSAAFINGPQVDEFAINLAKYLKCDFVIPCANGTDALQIAMMALDLKQGDEVIVPSFTYVATAEVIGLLGLTPVMVDVDPTFFNIKIEDIRTAITAKTKAIVPVHLYGQCADMESILDIAKEHNLFVIEDTAQAIGAEYTFKDGRVKKAGTMGDIGCTSFFPSKNLGCYGDGGAICTNSPELNKKIKMIANHGQSQKYVHTCIGVNSRLDTLQAAILNVKLKYLDDYSRARNNVAKYYNEHLCGLDAVETPIKLPNSTHVFHQYTIKVRNGKRNELKEFLEGNGIPAMIYYPIPLNEQEAFRSIGRKVGQLNNTIKLCEQVLSLPIHTEFSNEELNYIATTMQTFFNK